MVHVEISDTALLEAIRRKKPNWMDKASRKLAKALQTGKIGEGDAIWSEIKEVFILLQEFKCIYCETLLPKVDPDSANKVRIAYDVEHFRPKNRVTPWPTVEVLERRPNVADYQGSVFPGASDGYPKLAFDPFNYFVSCKICNTSYKADHFPIAGKPDTESTRRAALDAREKPLLFFPMGTQGDDPEKFLDFHGPLPCIRPMSAQNRLRARTVIDFFELDTREDLFTGRCILIRLLWNNLEEQSSDDLAERTESEAFLRLILEPSDWPHRACGRAFIKLYEQDRDRAQICYRAAGKFLNKKDPTLFQELAHWP
jgi:hypothetical protein